MAKKKKKYYTVWKGHHTGVFESWDDCKAQIKDFKGAQYKSFESFEAAKKALKGNYKDYIGKNKIKNDLSEEQIKKIGQPNYNSISVDAAQVVILEKWNIEVLIQNQKTIFLNKVLLKKAPIILVSFLAIVHGLAF